MMHRVATPGAGVIRGVFAGGISSRDGSGEERGDECKPGAH
jgi:hypothetical protein